MTSSPTLTDIEARLSREVATLLSLLPDQVSPETPLEDLGFDSLRLLEIFVFVEKQFSLRLMDAPISRQDLANLRALAQHILHRLQSTAS